SPSRCEVCANRDGRLNKALYDAGMNTKLAIGLLTSISVLFASRSPAEPPRVGPAGPGETVVSTGQFIRPAGKSCEIETRPVALVRSPDGRFLFVKDNLGITVIDVADMAVPQ